MRNRIRAVLLAAVTVTACALGSGAASAYTLPPADGQFDYQIGGDYSPLAAVRVSSRDRLVDPVDPRGGSVYDVCYVNTFQTQPDEIAWWRANHPTLLLRNASGNYVGDPMWGEILLDTRTSAKRTALSRIMNGWFAGCADKGYDAIEPDNLDTWTRSQGLITKANNVNMMRLLTAGAHAEDLAIAQKNVSPELGAQGPAIGFDFSIVEECQVWSECGPVLTNYGGRVYEIEYTDNEEVAGDGGYGYFDRACSARGATISVILRDRYVTPSGDPDYVYDDC